MTAIPPNSSITTPTLKFLGAGTTNEIYCELNSGEVIKIEFPKLTKDEFDLLTKNNRWIQIASCINDIVLRHHDTLFAKTTIHSSGVQVEKKYVGHQIAGTKGLYDLFCQTLYSYKNAPKSTTSPLPMTNPTASVTQPPPQPPTPRTPNPFASLSSFSNYSPFPLPNPNPIPTASSSNSSTKITLKTNKKKKQKPNPPPPPVTTRPANAKRVKNKTPTPAPKPLSATGASKPPSTKPPSVPKVSTEIHLSSDDEDDDLINSIKRKPAAQPKTPKPAEDEWIFPNFDDSETPLLSDHESEYESSSASEGEDVRITPIKSVKGKDKKPVDEATGLLAKGKKGSPTSSPNSSADDSDEDEDFTFV